MERLSKEELLKLVAVYKAIGDAGRLKIVLLLLDGKKSVGEIANLCGTKQSATSHALRILKDAKILDLQKDGNVSYYFIADEHVRSVIETSIEHLGC